MYGYTGIINILVFYGISTYIKLVFTYDQLQDAIYPFTQKWKGGIMYVANILGLLFCIQLVNNGHLIQSILRKDPSFSFPPKMIFKLFDMGKILIHWGLLFYVNQIYLYKFTKTC